ncbi:MAG: ribosomal RNA small subunit methyltransferase A [Bdellovibrionales bacterium RBG_16_40_8]|nr:MAG: ribosomal RNA small subunit methyltransferase A [Bdellovibrionales bacterium RBG_16_40_8]
MHSLGISPKRSLGQNFLISQHIVEKIFQELERRSPAFVVEIGPGLGVLTEQLIARKIPRKLIELDRKFAQYWREHAETVIEDDVLNVNLANLGLPRQTWLIGNLPYQIGSRLVVDLSLGPGEISGLIFMFQKEVAQRLMAQISTKDYGFLSVIAQTFWTIDKVVDASSEDFYPAPKVSSRVIVFRRRVVDTHFDEKYISFVKRAFQFRRKYMLKSFIDQEDKLKNSFTALNIKNTVRAEELSPEVFQKLFILYNSETK